MASLNFEKGFDDYVNSHQKEWAHDRSQSLGASEAFGCLRKAFFEKRGYEPDFDAKESWGALQRGDLIENHFVVPITRWLLEQQSDEAQILYAGDEQRTLIDERLSATPDGLVIYADDDALTNYGIESLGSDGDVEHPSACFCFEIKSIDPRVNLKSEKMIHHGQTQVQMGLIRKHTSWRPNFAVIIYIDASFFDDISVFIVPFDQQAYDAAVLRSKTVYNTDDPAMIMPEGKIDDDCKYCNFKRACAIVQRETMPAEKTAAGDGDLPPELMEEFIALATAERVASEAKKAVERDQKEASEKLKAWLREIGVRRVETQEGLKASISWTKGRKSFDQKAAAAAGLDLDPFMKESEGYDRLIVSEKGSVRADD